MSIWKYKISTHIKKQITLLNPKQQYDTVNYAKCICNRGWGTLKTDEISCCYAQKSKFMAFLFEFVLGFGIGHLYMGRMINFYIKFFVYVIMICSFCTIVCCLDNVIAKRNLKFMNILLMIICYFYIFWQFLDSVLIGVGYYKDDKDMDLFNWWLY